MEPTFRVFVDDRRAATTVGLVGELDVSGAAVLDDHIDSRRHAVALVDARYVSFIDAAGIGALLRLADGRPLSVVGSSTVTWLITLCRLRSHLLPETSPPPPAFDDAPFGVIEVREDDSITYVNRHLAESLGLAPEVFITQRWTQVLGLAGLRSTVRRAWSGRGAHCTTTPSGRPDVGAGLRWTVWQADSTPSRRRVVAIAERV